MLNNNIRTRTVAFAVLLVFITLLSGCSKKKSDDISKGFQVKQDKNSKFWFVDPQGRQFLSMGIDNIVCEPWNPRPNTDYYAPLTDLYDNNFENWNSYVVELLQANGFNTFASWSDPRLHGKDMYSTICLYVIEHVPARCLEGLRPGFEEKVRTNTQKMLAKYENLDNCVGFYLDNEMPWFGESGWDDISTYTLLEVAFSAPADDPAHQAARNFLKDRYVTCQAFSKAWEKPLKTWDDLDTKLLRMCLNDQTQVDRNDFTELVAEAFFAPACRIVRELAPGKLILGVRFSGPAPEGVIRACGRHCDVISYNNYQPSPEPDVGMLTQYWIWSGKKPLMITEYSWRGEENTSGNPNTGGAGSVVKTQAERAVNYQKYVESMLAHPMVIGLHWFEFADQSPQGRFDGENSNYGVVDIKDRPYTELLTAMAETNGHAENIHRNSSVIAPQKVPERPAVVFSPGQHPERPPSIDLIAEEAISSPELFHAPDASLTTTSNDGMLKIDYNAGSQWGCGILFYGPKSLAVGRGPEQATDLDGYSLLVLDAEIPEGLSIEIIVDEAGADEKAMPSYNIAAGDDGESFIFNTIEGSGRRSTFKLNFKDLQPRITWGNQKGFRRVDMHAMKGIGLYIRAGYGEGTIKLYSLKLVR